MSVVFLSKPELPSRDTDQTFQPTRNSQQVSGVAMGIFSMGCNPNINPEQSRREKMHSREQEHTRIEEYFDGLTGKAN